jgi:membrane protein implicated in regulation of membrane protease activity
MGAINRIREIDHHVATVISATTQPLSDGMIWGINFFKNLPIEERKEVDIYTPSPMEIAKSGIDLFADYHIRVLKTTSRWSEGVRNRVEWLLSKSLFPLSFCKIGKALQHSISYDLIGSVAQIVAFCALHVFHLVPYVVISTLIVGSVTMYYTDPYTLTSILAGAMLLTNLWFIYRLVKTVESTHKTFQQKADEFIYNWNMVELVKNTLRSTVNIIVRGGIWTYSMGKSSLAQIGICKKNQKPRP